MNKKLETGLCRGRRTDPPADISAKKNIPRLPRNQGQRCLSLPPVSARRRLPSSPLPTYTSPIIWSITTNTKKSEWQRGEKTDRGGGEGNSSYSLYMRNYAGKRQKEEENQDRQCKRERTYLLMTASSWGSHPSAELQVGSRAGIKSQLQKKLWKALSHHPAFAPLQHKASHLAQSSCWHELHPPTPPKSQLQLTVVRSCCSPPPSMPKHAPELQKPGPRGCRTRGDQVSAHCLMHAFS